MTFTVVPPVWRQGWFIGMMPARSTLLDEPVENPTMEYFEGHGFRYTTYTLDPDGHVASEAYNVAAPFPGVVRQTIERFIAGRRCPMSCARR